MPFDADKFEQAEFRARTESVSVPALSDFFGEGEDPAFLVRGLNSNELGAADEAAKSIRTTIEKLAEAIADDASVHKIREAIGQGRKATPAEVAKRLEMLVAGCVEPSLKMATAARIAENFPIEFQLLTNTIARLTGLGSELVKQDAASLPIAS